MSTDQHPVPDQETKGPAGSSGEAGLHEILPYMAPMFAFLALPAWKATYPAALSRIRSRTRSGRNRRGGGLVLSIGMVGPAPRSFCEQYCPRNPYRPCRLRAMDRT